MTELAREIISTADLWLRAAEADYRLCRALADRFEARLGRSLRGQRVGWESGGQPGFALLLPDPMPAARLSDDDWHLYSPTREILFRRTHAERERMEMIVLAESVEDWAELLRQALREEVYDLRWEVTPLYLDAMGEPSDMRSGYEFVPSAYAPQAVAVTPINLYGMGATPVEAARDACRRWLQAQGPNPE